MKLLVMVVPTEARLELETVLEGCQVSGFTEIPEVYGEGASGRRFGSRRAPGVSALVFTALPEECLPRIEAALRSLEQKTRVHIARFLVPLEAMPSAAIELPPPDAASAR